MTEIDDVVEQLVIQHFSHIRDMCAENREVKNHAALWITITTDSYFCVVCVTVHSAA